ncbi:hypothetical protein CAP35_12295 [Chitinophagaceae bacterium IBVUCB1]|nr:hypothetical protein CAP35_12295 [Chitinophagaceae bacterium IBVUCB1]
MSCRTANPRPAIAVAGIATEMHQAREQILPMLSELKDMRLIKFEEPSAISIKLTLLGFTVTR